MTSKSTAYMTCERFSPGIEDMTRRASRDVRSIGRLNGCTGAAASSGWERGEFRDASWCGGCRDQRALRQERPATAVTRRIREFAARGWAVRAFRATTSMWREGGKRKCALVPPRAVGECGGVECTPARGGHECWSWPAISNRRSCEGDGAAPSSLATTKRCEGREALQALSARSA